MPGQESLRQRITLHTLPSTSPAYTIAKKEKLRQWREQIESCSLKQQIIGYSLAERILLAVYVERGERTRIISARRATRHERKLYENA
jgi:uncharacterized DUF497 family protein